MEIKSVVHTAVHKALLPHVCLYKCLRTLNWKITSGHLTNKECDKELITINFVTLTWKPIFKKKLPCINATDIAPAV